MPSERNEPAHEAPFLSSDEGALLLRIARSSIESSIQRGERLDLSDYPLTPRLRERHGAFVTLRTPEGELRGCIGCTACIEPLAETVRDNAVNAATRDPRFTPVTADELPGLRIEVSALHPGDTPDSPFIVVRDLDEIALGRDGLYLAHAGSRGGGLLLPQVPVEQGWDREQYLEALCRKAGARPRAWERPGVTLHRFSAQVFHE